MGSTIRQGLFLHALGVALALPTFLVIASGSVSAHPAEPDPAAAPSVAQASPEPSSPPAKTEKGAGRTSDSGPPPHVARMNYIPTIDIIPQSTFATGGDYTPGQPIPDGTVRVGGKITQPIYGNLTASYQHGYIDEAIGNPGRPINGFVDDPIDDWRLNYGVSKAFNTSLGYFYRHRTCCSAANDPTNLQPITVHEAYLELDYAFPAIAALHGAQFSVTGRLTQTLAHHPTPQSVLDANPQVGADEGDRLWPTAGASVAVPLYPGSGFTVFGSYAFAKDYFDYQPIAFWYNIVDYGFTKSVNPNVSFTLDSSNLTQHKQGYPFAGFNTIHRTKVVLSVGFHFAPKSP